MTASTKLIGIQVAEENIFKTNIKLAEFTRSPANCRPRIAALPSH